MDNSVVFCPVITGIQKIILYETKSKFFVCGSNDSETRFKVLKIDRTEPYDLVVVDDRMEYTKQEMNQILNIGCKGKASASKTVSAFGIVGFIRFLEGYYMILITKRRRIATVGLHVIYKIEDTSMIYIPYDSHRVPSSDEARYLKMFQSVDLSSNFYFSYSYDITSTLQINMAPPSIDVQNLTSGTETSNNAVITKGLNQYCGVKNRVNRKFVWNLHLLRDVESEITPDWILYITHGFIDQCSVCIFGRPVYVTLIARRSNKYAGTRFLKRGANFHGDVANEVETEQMVIDVGVSSAGHLRASSFVQLRGSIPAQWSQDVIKMVAKPAITFDLSDPFFETAGAHFNELLQRYGSPIVVINLVKNREKKKHESHLSEEFSSAISYLNQFLPPKHCINYVTFDMARMNKSKEAKVMGRLAKIACSAISKTGFFLNDAPPINEPVLDKVTEGSSLQTGIIRVNCIDCLDRTNTAQFALGKCALAYQLYYLGLLTSPTLEFDTDCVRSLEVLYEDHGDTLALQYGGSHLVHRIKTYRKTAPWTSQGNDIMQTLSRYYSNTFSDTEKQHAINLFLGLYNPREHKQPIWEQITDYYLHHPPDVRLYQDRRFPLTQWWDPEVLQCLPMSYNLINKQCSYYIPMLTRFSECIDIYNHFYRTDEFTVIGDTYEFKMSHSIRDFMPRCVTDYSPFTVRVRPGRMREETAKSGGNAKNPSLTGQSSTSSTNSSTSSSCESDDADDESHDADSEEFSSLREDTSSFSQILSSPYKTYGIKTGNNVSESNLAMYRRYAFIGLVSTECVNQKNRNTFFRESAFSGDSFHIPLPCVDEKSKNVYKNYVDRSLSISCNSDTVYKYQRYVGHELGVFY